MPCLSGMSRRLVSACVAAGALAVGVAGVAGACARPRPPETTADAAAAAAQAPTGVPLRVENRNFNDVAIWVERSGSRTRLGTVSGSSEATLSIPRHLWANPEGIRLAAETVGQRSARADGTAAIGDRRVVTERLVLAAGQRVTWTIESGLQRSHVGIQ